MSYRIEMCTLTILPPPSPPPPPPMLRNSGIFQGQGQKFAKQLKFSTPSILRSIFLSLNETVNYCSFYIHIGTDVHGGLTFNNEAASQEMACKQQLFYYQQLLIINTVNYKRYLILRQHMNIIYLQHNIILHYTVCKM